MRKEEEPFAEDAALIERILAFGIDHEPLAEPEMQNRSELPSNTHPAHAHVALGVGDQAHRRLASEVDDLPPIVALALRRVPVDRRRQPRGVLRSRAP